MPSGTRVFIGTQNRTKLERILLMLEGLPIDPVSPLDGDEIPSPNEVGDEPESIARVKAMYYREATGLPSISIDSALYIDSLPEDLQPGVYIRRLGGPALSDEQLLAAIIELLRAHGGESAGHWTSGVAIAVSGTEIRSTSYRSERIFRPVACEVRTPDEPLNSIAYIPEYKRYYAELSETQRAELNSSYTNIVRNIVSKALKISGY